jgi:mRNA interferase HicA
MKYSEFRRWLKKQGCEFETHEGGSGHITVTYKGRKSQLPAHGQGKDLGTGLVQSIKKQLGLK